MQAIVVILTEESEGLVRGTCGEIVAIDGDHCDLRIRNIGGEYLSRNVLLAAVSSDPRDFAEILRERITNMRSALLRIEQSKNIDDMRNIAAEAKAASYR